MRKTKDHPELRFQKEFIKNTNKVLKNATCIASEYPLYPISTILSREYQEKMTGETSLRGSVGRIDLIFRYKKAFYIGEIKYTPCNSRDFWNAMKVLGYTELYKFQTGHKGKVTPAIIMPRERIRLEHQFISGRLGIQLFGIKSNKEKTEFTLQKISDKPHWQQ